MSSKKLPSITSRTRERSTSTASQLQSTDDKNADSWVEIRVSDSHVDTRELERQVNQSSGRRSLFSRLREGINSLLKKFKVKLSVLFDSESDTSGAAGAIQIHSRVSTNYVVPRDTLQIPANYRPPTITTPDRATCTRTDSSTCTNPATRTDRGTSTATRTDRGTGTGTATRTDGGTGTATKTDSSANPATRTDSSTNPATRTDRGTGTGKATRTDGGTSTATGTDRGTATATKTDSSTNPATRTDRGTGTTTRTDRARGTDTATRTDRGTGTATRIVKCAIPVATRTANTPAVSHDRQLNKLQREVETLSIHSTNVEVHIPNELIGRILFHYFRQLPEVVQNRRYAETTCRINESHTLISLSGNCPDTLRRLIEILQGIEIQIESNIISELLPVHSMCFPMLNNPAIAEAIRTVEQTHHVAVSILQKSGNPLRISELASTPNPSAGSLLQLCELNNFIIPCTPTVHQMVWVVRNAQGETMPVRGDLNQHLNDCYYNQHLDRTTFTLNGEEYAVSFQADTCTITEVSSGIFQQLTRQTQPITWSYLVPNVGYVAHEMRDSEAIEQMYQYGGDCILLAGSQHTFNFDSNSMCQIDLTTGNRVELRREPMPEVSTLPQYNVVLAISGLPEDVNNAKCQLEKILRSKTHSRDVTGIPQVECAQQIILHKARQYCIHVSPQLIRNSNIMWIRLEGDQYHVNTVHAHLSQWCKELQAQLASLMMSQVPAPSQAQYGVPQQTTSGIQHHVPQQITSGTQNHSHRTARAQSYNQQGSRSTSGTQNHVTLSWPNAGEVNSTNRGVYVDNAMNRRLGRVGLPLGTVVQHKDGHVSYGAARGQPQNHFILPQQQTFTSRTHSHSHDLASIARAQPQTDQHSSYCRPAGTIQNCMSQPNAGEDTSTNRGVYVDNAMNRRLGRVGLPRGTVVQHKDGRCN